MALQDRRLTGSVDSGDKVQTLAEVAMSTSASQVVTAGTPVKAAGTTGAVVTSQGLTTTMNTGKITYDGPTGLFVVFAQVSITGLNENFSNPITYLALNGSIIAATRMQKATNRAKELGSNSFQWLLELKKDDFLEVFIDVDASDTMTVERMVLTLLG